MDIDDPKIIGKMSITCFFVTMPLREFVSAGGELIIHAATHLINSPTPCYVSPDTFNGELAYEIIIV